jgi:hypothetical protein
LICIKCGEIYSPPDESVLFCDKCAATATNEDKEFELAAKELEDWEKEQEAFLLHLFD